MKCCKQVHFYGTNAKGRGSVVRILRWAGREMSIIELLTKTPRGAY